MDAKLLDKAAKSTAQVSAIGGYIAGVASLLVLGLVLSEIIARTFLHTSLLITLEVSEWLLVTIVFLGTAWTLKDGGHVRINLITGRLSQQAQQRISIVVAIISIAFLVWVSIYAWQGLIDNYVGGVKGYSSTYRLPVWWAWVPLCLGVGILAIQFVGLVLENIASLRSLGRRQDWTGSIALALLVVAGLGAIMWVYASSAITGLGWLMLLLIILIIVFALILSSLWICISLMVAGTMAMFMFTPYPAGYGTPQLFFSANASFILVCLPLFIFMGEMLYHSGASNTLYSGITPWVEKIPGRLLHSNVFACTLFAAISGSSAATCATIGSVAVPELSKRGYDRSISIGSLAGAGTLGLLIPPSITLIVYGALTATSVGALFAGGVVPGLVISALFASYIAITAIRRPLIAPPSQTYTWGRRMWGIVQIIPFLVLIGLVLGLIYIGITTPTEAGAIGSGCSIVIALAYRRLSWRVLRQVLFATIRTTAMIMFIYTGASVLSSAIAYLMIPQQLAEAIAVLGISRYAVLGILCFIYVLMGCLFDGVSMMVLTLPIVFPLITRLGFDPIWFGVLLTVLIETAQITPPVGLNLYVLQTLTGEEIGTIVRNAIPFFLILLLGVVILVFFPELVLWLPSMM